MKKFISVLVMQFITCITVMGQVWFYIPSGEDPETYNSPDVQAVYIIIKDTNGDLWFLYSKTKTVIENLLDNINFYADAFNNGTHQKSDYNIMTMTTTTYTVENEKYTSGGTFCKAIMKEKTEKCTVLASAGILNGPGALSHDFKTLIPSIQYKKYYTNVAANRLIARRKRQTVDDLF